MTTYEGMFLVPPGVADFQKASEPVRKVLDRVEAEVLALNPWDERRLAYEVQRQKRGLYILTYFKVDPSRMDDLEHDCQLNEDILRVLFLRRDKLDKETIEASTPAMAKADHERKVEEDAKAAAIAAEKAAEEKVKTDAEELAAAALADAAPAEKADAPAAEKADAPVAEKADAPAAEKADAPVAEKADAPVAEKAEAPAAEKADAPAAEKAEALAEQKPDQVQQEAPNETATDDKPQDA